MEEVSEEESLKNVKNVMKNILPTNFTVDDDALSLIKTCVLQFISSMSCEAVSKCVHDGRKTLTGSDVVNALNNVGFDDYVEPMNIYVAKIVTHPAVIEASKVESLSMMQKNTSAKKKKTDDETKESSVPKRSKPSKQSAVPVKSPPTIATTSTIDSHRTANSVLKADSGTDSASGSNGNTSSSGGPTFQERVSIALNVARLNPTCDLKLLASQVPVSFHYFTDRLKALIASTPPVNDPESTSSEPHQINPNGVSISSEGPRPAQPDAIRIGNNSSDSAQNRPANKPIFTIEES